MTFLTVPYAEKDEAKALGAKWNPKRKCWYVPPGVALEPFEKWLKESGSAPAARVDSYAAKPVVGAQFVELEHDCNPFEACAQCASALERSGWSAAHAKLLSALAALGR